MSHAKLPPSGSKRWLLCAGSVRASEGIVDTGGDAADLGTAGHMLFERALKSGRPPAHWAHGVFTLDNGVKIEVTDEMVDRVAEMVGWVGAYVKKHPGCVRQHEVKVEIGAKAFDLAPGLLYGTADLLIYTDEELCVFDLKMGYVDVEVEENPQVALYALGVEEPGGTVKKCRFVIGQPQSGEPKEWLTDMAWLHGWRDAHRAQVLAALDPYSPRTPSEIACRWCPAAPQCVELKEHALAVARDEFLSPQHYTVEEYAEILGKAVLVRHWLTAIEEHALRLAKGGTVFPGFKLVRARRHRQWTNVEEACAALSKLGLKVDDYAPREMVSPAQAEDLACKTKKKLAKKKLQPFIVTPEGESTLVPESDKRSAVESDVAALLRVAKGDFVDAEVVEEDYSDIV